MKQLELLPRGKQQLVVGKVGKLYRTEMTNTEIADKLKLPIELVDEIIEDILVPIEKKMKNS